MAGDQKLNIETLRDPTVPLPEEVKAVNNADSCLRGFIATLFTIVKRQKPFKCASSNEYIHTHNALWLSLKKERNSDTCYNMGEPGKHCTI